MPVLLRAAPSIVAPRLKHALLDDAAALQTFIAAAEFVVGGTSGEEAHRAVLMHYAHHQARMFEFAGANCSALEHMTANLIAVGAFVKAGDLVARLKHRQSDFLFCVAAPKIGGGALAIRNADALPHAAYPTVGAGRLIRCDRRLRSDVDWWWAPGHGASTDCNRECGH